MIDICKVNKKKHHRLDDTKTYISSDDIVIVPTAKAFIFPSACIA